MQAVVSPQFLHLFIRVGIQLAKALKEPRKARRAWKSLFGEFTESERASLILLKLTLVFIYSFLSCVPMPVPPSHSTNSPEWIKAMIACSITSVCVPLYDALSGDDSVAYCIVHSGMEHVFVQVSGGVKGCVCVCVCVCVCAKECGCGE